MRKDIIESWANQNGFAISPTQMELLASYQQLVLTAKMNLTAITDDADFAVKHFIDSMTLLPYIKQGATVIDLGTGAGFPGLVLRILREDIKKMDLLDSRKKRVEFLMQTITELGLSRVDCIPARAEEWARIGAQYDICTARAVATLDKLAKYALPLTTPGGLFLAMKGSDVEDELEKAKPAIEKYGGLIESIDIVEIGAGIRHSIVVIRKS